MTTTQQAMLHIERPHPDIVRLSLRNSTGMNTLTWEMLESLMNVFQELRRNPPRALILTGEGRVFCGGANLKYFTDPASSLANNPRDTRDVYVRRILDVFGVIRTLPFPVIAAINGHALGGGMELAIACDFRLMSASARMGQPEVRHGLAAGGNGIQQLIHLIGRQKALDMLLTGDAITAETALAYGLVASIHTPETLDDAALAFARRFLCAGPQAVAITKRAAYRAEDAPPAEADAIALDAVYESFSTPESREGLSAFVGKRRAAYVQIAESER